MAPADVMFAEIVSGLPESIVTIWSRPRSR